MSMLEQIRHQLQSSLEPSHLEVVNESYKHRVEPGSESHFKAVVVTDAFEGLRTIKRHQQIYALLQQEMTLIHALALHTYTPSEWAQREAAPQTPNCMGGE
ncbi:BolA/IbaG family iron-sulfur metabolism protein [Aestuariirhabdus sp. Z084]|uniref:BolA family protein n=1 Tax=Aestuariirhabdus haliotis TaxID=2918751 RepID=UPI00201B4135|nr:BolA/IbaG family iron-sulfur metabolism protein [Aestuariirhabdus haliotis]MCL6417310.1 BolA/IbaG family iron-sulfur metabolism protein [Aestuariirhabdus haliotis]MCL6421255.1 BolA/IbaG family iron-sulfur metabolism protein [Aestuariirhabdus haliotis]